MELRDIRSKAQFPSFYKSKGLINLSDKINFLTKEMGILFTRYGGEWTEQEELQNLEQHALESWDRIPPGAHD